jgi:hypothetical protein
MSWAYWA